MCTSDGFNPDTYKLMEKSGYDFSKPPSLGHIIGAKPYGPNDAQKIVQKQGSGIMTPRIGRCYMPPGLVKIARRFKDKQSLTQYVMAEEVGNDKGDNAMSNPKSSVFDRLQPSTPQ